MVFWSGFAVPGASARFTAFIDVTVVPMDTERVVPHQTVLVRDGIIVEMGSADEVTIPVSTERIDGKGRYLMPGLADLHTHIEQETELLPYVAHGVTSVLNLGSPASVLTLRDRIGAGQLLGPTLYAGAYVDGPESNAYWTIGTPDEARRVVREIKAAGWDVIKAYNSIPLEPYLAMMEEARAQDIAVVGHGVRAPGMQGLLDAGQVMVAHAEEYLYTHFRTSGSPAHISAAVEMTREAGAFVVPNLSAYETIAHQWGNQAGFDSLLARPEVRFVPPGRVEEWKRSNPYLNRTGELFSRLSFLRNFTKALHDGGVPLLLGTDSPPISMIPGFSIYQDLEEMVDAGLTPYEALASGTRNAGLFAQRHLRERTPFGTVATGHRADLILLAENPLVDVDHVKERVGVMVRGTWFSEVALQHRLADLVASFVPEQVFSGSGSQPGHRCREQDFS